MKQYKILIVEDDRQLADLTAINFPKNRFIVKTCYSGREAVENVQKDKPDLIILDVVMPEMDGWETILKLKESVLTSSIPVIMCTGKDSVRDVEKSFHYGAQGYIMKPINFKLLLHKVSSVLNIEDMLNE